MLPLVTQPTAIIWGKEDKVLRPTGAAELAAALPNASTQVFFLPQSGHVPMIEQHEMVVAIMRNWLRQ
jgi:pimeloyl-ACP methyl ester carboxylesterase